MATRIKSFYVAAFVGASALISSSLWAATPKGEMEVITVTYQASLHYAVNQHLTESISGFHAARQQLIVDDARLQTQQMAQSFHEDTLQPIDIAANLSLPTHLDNDDVHH
ncbi:hypothetical protein HR45_16505 [Shewanella mangrovi]|uniref:Uncharacterized protein n=1 Tax=Shewanella mangrovi TaxID=1515746 RepID=A0A094JB24_9GAMM|nr:hypothetical protein [Shewanella mangrovi]KFZ36417.1 hypothetical protein HR45_16505 [Shewanella mangrovi]